MTTPPPPASLTTQSCLVRPKLWTCGFIGCVAMPPKINSIFIGNPRDSTGETTSLNITSYCTMRPTNIPTLANPCLTHILVGRQSIKKINNLHFYFYLHDHYMPSPTGVCFTALSTHRSTYITHCNTRIHDPRETYTWSSHNSDSVAPVGIAGRLQTARRP